MPTDFDAQRDLQPELDTSERLQWAGRPKQGILFHGSDVFLIPFSLLWCGFAIYLEVSAAKGGANLSFLAFGAFFVVAGLYFVVGRFLIDALMRKNTLYGITDERVIIRSGVFSRQLKSLNLRTLSDISLSEKRSGEGTISLGPSSPWDIWGQGFNWPGLPASVPKFEGLSDAKQVYDILLKAQKNC